MSPRSHESWKEQLPAYLLGALSPGEKTDLEHHLGGCAECQAELRWLEPAKERLVADVEQVAPTPGLKSRLMAAVEADLREHPVAEPASEVVPDRPGGHTGAGRPERSRGTRRGWLDFGQLLRPATVGALAVTLFAGVVVGYAVNGGDGGDSPEEPTRVVESVPSPVGRAEATMVATGGSGTIRMSHLEPLEEGEVYQAWIQKGQSVEPTESLFTPNRHGDATASIPNLSDVDAVMISAEPKGGSSQPTSAPIITIEMPS